MSPEQSHGDALDGRSDLFALGVVLFEMLPGTRPFDGATYLATQLNAVQGKRKDVRDLAPEAPALLVGIVDRLLEPDRERRFGSADELLDALSETPVPANVVRALAALARGASAFPVGDPTACDGPKTGQPAVVVQRDTPLRRRSRGKSILVVASSGERPR